MKKLIYLFFLLYANSFVNAQCTGGSAGVALSPTTSFQTKNVKNGKYYTVSVNQCDSYTFTFCSGGGSASWDTQITLLDATGATTLAFNDDNCSLQSEVVWTASFTGTIRVLITEFSCNLDLSQTGTLAYKTTPHTGNYCLYGNANEQVIGGENCIELTQAVNDQTGCAWNTTPIDFSQVFQLNLQYYFGASINGADGTTFTFLPSPSGCGSAGGELGAGGLSNALTVEFDTYDNDNPSHIFDLAADHIAVDINGELLGPGAPLCGPVPATPTSANIDDGATHQVQISWDPSTMELDIYFDGNLRLTCTYDFINNLFGGQTQIYWGATAATGGLNNQQYFCPNTVVLPVKLTEFKTSCESQKNHIEWTSGSEHRLDYYSLEYTYDGYVFYPLGKVTAKGDSDTPLSYHYDDASKYKNQAYYRLTSVDKDGKSEMSSLISALNCVQGGNKLIEYVNTSTGVVDVHFAANQVYYQVYDLSGKAVTPVIYNNSQVEEKIISTFDSGIYILKAWDAKGTKSENYKISVL